MAPADHPNPVSVLKRTLQITGFLAGLAVLGWVIWTAANSIDAATLDRLRETPLSRFLMLAGLSAATILLNGLMWW
ncbi:MAG: hypothetical protein AAF235_12105, partial [Planctomycetota bacterium]